MTDFINDWVRCNVCFKGFDKSGGMLTSCGHFFCGRKGCKIDAKPGEKLVCPICHSECGAISLTDSLPGDILQFFEEPSDIIQKALDVLKFHNHQKELARIHYEKATTRIRELEEKVSQLEKENQALIESRNENNIESNDNRKIKSECFIPGIIEPAPIGKKKQEKELFPTKKKKNEFQKKLLEKGENEDKILSTERKEQPISKLFTPTLASRLQSITGKKIYTPVQPHE